MNILKAIKEVYKGELITHYDWNDINQVSYVKVVNCIPVRYLRGDHFRRVLRGTDEDIILTCNPFKVFNKKSNYENLNDIYNYFK